MRLVGQSPDIGITWYSEDGLGRHHSLRVCMRYRGVNLEESAESDGVYTDGKSWMKEGFLMLGGGVLDYPAYLRRTFVPFADKGVHLLAMAPCGSLSANAFDVSVDALFSRVEQLAEKRSASEGLVAVAEKEPIN